ncbi:MAG TPA: c-type cytochrome domain-containing protein [Humisphaera sp.]|nr:c-type cytochrome domain-containing protein [Humisphaera sp.]
MFLLCLTLPARADVSFLRDVAPILIQRCTACHGERKDSGDFRAQTFENLMHTGSPDEIPVVPGRPEKSALFKLISSADPDERMPQKDDPLSPQHIEIIRKWIAQGARFDGADKTAAIKSLLGPRQHPLAPAVYRVAAPVMAVAFGPGGKELAAGGYNEVTIWDPATGNLLRRIPHLPQRIQAAHYSQDGHELLIAGGTPGDYGELTIADPTASNPPRVLDTFDDIVLACAYGPDGKRIAAGGADQSVRLYDRQTGKRLWTARLHADWVTAVAFSSDGRFVLSASRDMTVKVYDAATGSLYTSYAGHNRQIGAHKGSGPVYDVVCSPDSPLTMSAGGGQWIQLWEPDIVKADAGTAGDLEERFAKGGHTRYIEHGLGREIYRLALSKDKLFAASRDGAIKLFDLASLKEVRAFTGQTDWVFGLDFSADSGLLASGSADGQVRIWEADSGKPISNFYAAPGLVAAKSNGAASAK